MQYTKRVASLAIGLGMALTGAAHATLISGLGAPSSHAALTGATVVDFTSAALGTYDTLGLGDVTVSSGSPATFFITDALGGSYNVTGRNLQNGTTGTSVLNLLFSAPVSAFGFNFGASNEDWNLEAFDSGNSLIESHILTQTWFSDAGEFFGIAGSGIASARLTQLTHVNDSATDHILMDNISFVAGANVVPEPTSVMLLGIGLLGMAWRRSSHRA